MRSPRLKICDGSAVYHCVSRTAGGVFLFGPKEKEQFRKLMRLLADFCGVEIIAYTVMSNHFHILVRVPAPVEISDKELARRVRLLYGETSSYVLAIEQDLKSSNRISLQLRTRLLKRMGDISMFLKELKQRFTRWYNRQHERYGTLWAERFKSTLVEDQPSSVQAVAAYIDLNAVRAGLVEDPQDHPFCGYAEAIARDGKARAGLASCLRGATWRDKVQGYREYLFHRSGVSGHSEKKALSKDQILAMLKKNERLDLKTVLRVKVRYMLDGAVLGSEAFVNEIFRRFRKHFGKRRKEGAREMKGADWGPLRVLRALRHNIFE